MSARGRHRRQRVRRISRISLVLTAGGAGVALPLAAAGTANAAPAAHAAPAAETAGDRAAALAAPVAAQPAEAEQVASAGTYTVAKGDTLFHIATTEDVDGGWEALYDGNQDVIGDNPDLIKPGQELSLDVVGGAPVAQSAPAPQAAEPAPAPEPEPAPEPAPAPEPEPAPSAGFTSPVDAPPSTAYRVAGSSWSSGYHTGVDFAVSTGTPIKAVASGTVVTSGSGGSYGNEIVIRHDDGHYSQYAHLSSLGVSVGQTVAAGEQIGLAGSTGNSTGPHLHFEVRTGPGYGSDVDPLAYLRANGVTI
ncbi:M23 family metallopeptidase [Streptomyces marincola]|uniref:M23 family metallopeptidase n=1 Tax=Streptomyces marincola TaxID=2878388 RepID=UPI001CF14098|nr:M23 family metallopeptidase [Streptomyces marincola]UCM88429.1 LysM peptidoglycan-binding domain-containing M23 family metallopeptidase [Streptomyces marincola]